MQKYYDLLYLDGTMKVMIPSVFEAPLVEDEKLIIHEFLNMNPKEGVAGMQHNYD